MNINLNNKIVISVQYDESGNKYVIPLRISENFIEGEWLWK